MVCKDCKTKGGYIFTAVGCHTVMKRKCDDCGKIKTIWPSRHFKLAKKEIKVSADDKLL